MLLGIVTVDDVMDLDEIESTEDFYKFGASQRAIVDPITARFSSTKIGGCTSILLKLTLFGNVNHNIEFNHGLFIGLWILGPSFRIVQ